MYSVQNKSPSTQPPAIHVLPLWQQWTTFCMSFQKYSMYVQAHIQIFLKFNLNYFTYIILYHFFYSTTCLENHYIFPWSAALFSSYILLILGKAHNFINSSPFMAIKIVCIFCYYKATVTVLTHGPFCTYANVSAD